MTSLPLHQLTAPTLLLLVLFSSIASADSLALLTPHHHDSLRHHPHQQQQQQQQPHFSRTSMPILDALSRAVTSQLTSEASSAASAPSLPSSSSYEDLSSSEDFRSDDDEVEEDDEGILGNPADSSWRAQVLMNLVSYFPDADLDRRDGPDTLASILKRVRSKAVSGISRTSVPLGLSKRRGRGGKRVESRSRFPSLCHMLGFPEGSSGCVRSGYPYKKPDTRSPSAGQPSERNDWQSMYLLGGAIGR